MNFRLDMRGYREIGIAVSLVFSTLAFAASAQEVSGTFTVGPAVIEPNHAAAYKVRAGHDVNQSGILVFLSNVTVDVEAAVQAIDPHGHVLNQDVLGGSDHIAVYIWSKDEVAFNATLSEGNRQFVFNTEMGLESEILEHSDERVAGRVWTRAPVVMGEGGSYAIDVSFATPITRIEFTPLPAGGGEPGAALRSFAEALKAGNWAAIRPHLDPVTLADIEYWEESDEARASEATSNYPDWLTTAPLEIVGGELRPGGVAIVEAKAETIKDFFFLQGVRMYKVESGWIVDRIVMIGIL